MRDNLKGFDDLVFTQHKSCRVGEGIQAKLTFGRRDKDNSNQFTISVVQNVGRGTGLYGHQDDGTYEVAMWFQDRDTMLPLSKYDDILAYQTPMQITQLMHQAQLNDFAWVTLLHSIRDEADSSYADA
tara:strand:+ start:668 stop:1051 length:384 start_codon:yes stop_codon:yes gene_type:complete